jgi:hypothetical protein
LHRNRCVQLTRTSVVGGYVGESVAIVRSGPVGVFDGLRWDSRQLWVEIDGGPTGSSSEARFSPYRRRIPPPESIEGLMDISLWITVRAKTWLGLPLIPRFEAVRLTAAQNGHRLKRYDGSSSRSPPEYRCTPLLSPQCDVAVSTRQGVLTPLKVKRIGRCCPAGDRKRHCIHSRVVAPFGRRKRPRTGRWVFPTVRSRGSVGCWPLAIIPRRNRGHAYVLVSV